VKPGHHNKARRSRRGSTSLTVEGPYWILLSAPHIQVSKDRSLRVPAQLDAWRKEHELILRYINEHDDLTYTQIAAQMGISRSTVVRVAKAARIQRPRGPKLRLVFP
jgi:hypothetical protein